MSNRSRTPRSLMQKINKKNHKNSLHQVPPRHLRRGTVESFHPPYRLTCLSASGSGSKEKILCEMNILGKEQTHYAAINFTFYCVAVYRRSLTAENVIDKWIRKQKKNFSELSLPPSARSLNVCKLWNQHQSFYCLKCCRGVQQKLLLVNCNRDSKQVPCLAKQSWFTWCRRANRKSPFSFPRI